MLVALVVTLLVTALNLLSFLTFVHLDSGDAALGGLITAFAGIGVGTLVSGIQKKYAPLAFASASFVTLIACLTLTDDGWHLVVPSSLGAISVGLYLLTRHLHRIDEGLRKNSGPWWFFFPWVLPAAALELLEPRDLLALYALAQILAYALYLAKGKEWAR